MNHRHRCLVLLLLLPLSGLLWPNGGGAQEAGTTAPASAPAEPAPITTNELVRRLDEVNARLFQINEYLRKPAPDLAGITVALPDRTREAESVLGGIEDLDATRADTAELVVALQKLRNLERIFSRWRVRLQDEVAVLDPWGEQLRIDSTVLREAAGSGEGRDSELPESLRLRVVELADQIDSVRQPLRRRLDVVVGADVKVSQLQTSLRDLAGQIDATRLTRQQQPLARTAPPIWMLPESTRPLRQLLQENLGLMRTGLQDYVAVRPGELTTFIVIFVIACFAMLRLRRSILAPGSEATTASDQLLIRHPIAVVLLIWVLVGPLILLPDLPIALALIRGLIAVVLLWRMMPELVAPDDVRPLRALLLLALGLLLQLGLLADPWFGRVTNILFGLLALGVFRRLAHPDPEPVEARSDLRRITRAFARIAPFAIGIGIVAEVAGARSLGEQAIVGVVFASLILTAFVTADAVLDSVLRAWIGGPGSRSVRAVRNWPDAVRIWGTRVNRLVLLIALLNILPTILPVLEPVWRGFAGLLGTPFTIGSVEMSLGSVLWFVISIVLALLIARFIRFMLDEDVLPRMSLAMGAASAASRLIYYLLVVVGILFALAVSGVELSRLTLVVSALSVGIGFGLQNIVNNFVSGIILAFERPVREGDLVLLGQTTGRVQAIGLRATWIRTLEGAEVVIPNASLISGEVTNWTLSDRNRRIEIRVGVAYASDPQRVQAVLAEALTDLPGLADRPAPVVHFQSFGASSLEFRLLLWTTDSDNLLAVESDARARVLVALRKAGIEIPFNQLDVRLLNPLPPDLPASPSGSAPEPPVAG